METCSVSVNGHPQIREHSRQLGFGETWPVCNEPIDTACGGCRSEPSANEFSGKQTNKSHHLTGCGKHGSEAGGGPERSPERETAADYGTVADGNYESSLLVG